MSSATSPQTFQELGLKPWLIQALRAVAITAPTEIQRACIPPALAGRAVIGGAKTGSGKTATFALPILQELSDDPYGVFAVILTPTRELAFQIAEQFDVLGKGVSLRTCICVGGLDMTQQALELAQRPHIIVATPGRLADHIQSSAEAVHLSRTRYLVLDEADRLLQPTFAPELEVIMDQLPKKRKTMLFTATITDSILAIRDAPPPKGQEPPFFYQCATDIATVSSLKQRYLLVPSHVREAHLVALLRSEDLSGRSAILFVGRCNTAERLTRMLNECGLPSVGLHSRISQPQRLASLGKFRGSMVRILVATDVGSRGLDIPTVGLVVNYDVPRDPDDYVHRVGRTARAGRGGLAITIMGERDVELVHAIEDRIGTQLEEHDTLEEKEVLQLLNEVSKAKRIALMDMQEVEFGAKEEIRKRKAARVAGEQVHHGKGKKHKGPSSSMKEGRVVSTSKPKKTKVSTLS